jgi:hypothetical protein
VPGVQAWLRPLESFFAREGWEGASAWGDAGMRREVPFVAFSQLGKFLQDGEFPQVLEPKVNVGSPRITAKRPTENR